MLRETYVNKEYSQVLFCENEVCILEGALAFLSRFYILIQNNSDAESIMWYLQFI